MVGPAAGVLIYKENRLLDGTLNCLKGAGTAVNGQFKTCVAGQYPVNMSSNTL